MTDVVGAKPVARSEEFEQHRVGLTGYCYRMLGSAFEAEDAVQETMVRAWRAADRFEGRSSVRTWLHRIATNVCFDMLEGRQRRARPMDLTAVSVAPTTAVDPRGESTWVLPVPDGRALGIDLDLADPADAVVARESIKLAFIAALQHLPPRQRAVLILCEVLRWRADEVAALLESSVASVNSALQRARATLAASNVDLGHRPSPPDQREAALVERFVDAFERYDITELVTLLRNDVVMSMPPYNMWLRGRTDIHGWMVGPGYECQGSRLLPVRANGAPGFGQYRRSTTGRGHDPWALVVLEPVDGELAAMHFFLDTEAMFPLFGLPDHLDD